MRNTTLRRSRHRKTVSGRGSRKPMKSLCRFFSFRSRRITWECTQLKSHWGAMWFRTGVSSRADRGKKGQFVIKKLNNSWIIDRKVAKVLSGRIVSNQSMCNSLNYAHHATALPSNLSTKFCSKRSALVFLISFDSAPIDAIPPNDDKVIKILKKFCR